MMSYGAVPAPAQPCSSNAGSVLLLWGWTGVIFSAPGCSRDGAYWQQSKGKREGEGQVGEFGDFVGEGGRGGDLRLWRAGTKCGQVAGGTGGRGKLPSSRTFYYLPPYCLSPTAPR